MPPNNLVVREVACRTILNKSSFGGYSLNCYTGCGHACAYCYARSLEQFKPHQEDWGTFIDVKVNAIEVLKRQLRHAVPGSVFLSSACDGWQPLEEQYRLTRRCCQLLLERGFSLHLLTKSNLILRDFDILAGHPVNVGITVTTANEDVAQLWEPGCLPVAERWGVLRRAVAAGFSTTAMLSPLLPLISDSPAEIATLLQQADSCGAQKIWIDSLNPRRRVWPSVARLLRLHFPELRKDYQRILFDSVARQQYLTGLRETVDKVATQLGMHDRVRTCFSAEEES